MKTDFRFSNLLGTVYRKGNLAYTPDGNCLLSPIGNRVTVFDLTKNTSYTLPFSHRRNISRIALSPNGNLLLTVDVDGRAILTNFPRRIVLHHLSFRNKVTALAFSPSGHHFAAGVGRFVEVWHTPETPDSNSDGQLEFAPFVRHHVHAGHSDVVQGITWSSDSRFFLTASKDLTAKLWSLHPEEGFTPTTLPGHRQEVRAAWFSKDQETIYTISKDGALFDWKYMGRPLDDPDTEDGAVDDTEQRWRISQRHYFMQANSHLTCATFHPQSSLLVAGFSNGIFTLHELPDFNLIHTLSISQSHISHVSVNATGEWLAFGSSRHGQLLVWEWQSESYILKQQGHLDSTNAIAYSPDGSRIVTAADDGKLKVWDVASGFCVVTFTEHTSAVTACEFAKRGNVLFTASLDGSVRAWDMVRYRNFRTFTSTTRLSFSSLAVDPSGEVVCAGSLDSFDIAVWSVQTGQLLDQLAGHEGPVSTLAFAPNGSTLVSGSWDHTVRMWDIFARTQTSEPLQLQADVLTVTFRPDSAQIAVATLDGALTFWTVSDAVQAGIVDARRDVSGGRKLSDRRTAASAAGTKSFNTLAYSADGQVILAGGNSKNICLYATHSGVLLHKYTVSINLDLDGTQDYLNSRGLTEAGPRGLLEISENDDSEDEDQRHRGTAGALPGSSRGTGERSTRPAVRVPAVAFSPTSRAFCAASTEGLLIYSLDSSFTFDPIDLSIDVTPAAAMKALHESNDPLTALIMALRLNNSALINHVYTSVKLEQIPHVVQGLPISYLPRVLREVAIAMDSGPHLEFNLRWMESLLRLRGREIKESGAGTMGTELRLTQRAVKRVQTELGRLADDNGFRVDYLLSRPKAAASAGEEGGKELTMDDMIKGALTQGEAEMTVDELIGRSKANDTAKEREPVPQSVPTTHHDNDENDDWIGISD